MLPPNIQIGDRQNGATTNQKEPQRLSGCRGPWICGVRLACLAGHAATKRAVSVSCKTKGMPQAASCGAQTNVALWTPPGCRTFPLPQMPLVILKSATLTLFLAKDTAGRQAAMTMSCAQHFVKMWPAAVDQWTDCCCCCCCRLESDAVVPMSTPKTKAHCDQMSKWLQGVWATAAPVAAPAAAPS